MPLTKWQPPAPRHDVADDGRVTWLELFFDLIYVAALIQLGDRLADDVSWNGIAAFAGAFVLLWWTWTGTTAFMNRFAVDDITHRLLSFFQMFAVGNFAVIAATVPDNWRTWIALAYIGARLPLLLMYLRAQHSVARSEATTTLIRGFGSGLALWALSLLVPGDARLVVWAVAVAIEFAIPAFLVRRDSTTATEEINTPLHDHHFMERYALFTIIVLGETFVKALSKIADIGISLETQVMGGLAFLILIAIWWTYFDDVADAHIRSSSALTRTPESTRLVWVYTHLPLAGGITAFGVAAKKIVGVESFSDAFKDSYLWLLIGAVGVVLLCVAVLDLVTASPHYAIEAPERVGPRVVAAIALGVVGVVAAATSPPALATIAIIAAIVVAQIAVEVVAAHKSEYRIRELVRDVIDASAGACDHLLATDPAPRPAPADAVCDGCVANGTDPVQLRWCLICGHVGCCDDTPGTHARAHFEETGHAMIGSLERGATWAYCYLDDASAPDFFARDEEPDRTDR
ncbi:MAG: low temperature requirement protein A [Actinomycetota bacterium]